MSNKNIELENEKLVAHLFEILFNYEIQFKGEKNEADEMACYENESKRLNALAHEWQNSSVNCNIDEIRTFVTNLKEISGDEIYEYVLRKLMILSCFSMNKIGTYYFMNAVYLCKVNLKRYTKISISDVYREVGENFTVSPEAVEKSIRLSIKRAWNLCRMTNPQISVCKFIFPQMHEQPTNKEILIQISMQMKILEKVVEALNA